jgi:hypothetical protein
MPRKAVREKWLKEGLCGCCGKGDRVEGLTRCAACIGIRRWSPEDAKKSALSKKEKLEKGLCPRCSENRPVLFGLKSCKECRDKWLGGDKQVRVKVKVEKKKWSRLVIWKTKEKANDESNG